jgi:acyl-CoA thioester hydrolase
MSFEFETAIDLRYGDLDTYGHVNNAVYATLMEEARLNYLRTVLADVETDLASMDGGTGIVLANLEIDFERPLRDAEEVSVGVRVPSLGSSSIPFEYELRDDHGVVAVAETTLVVIDTESGQSIEIPDTWRAAIESFEGRD